MTGERRAAKASPAPGRRKLRSSLVVGLLLFTACSAVRHSAIRPDYEQVDRTKTLRLAVVTSPVPEGEESLGLLWSEIARRYVNDKRDFIASEQLTADQVPDDVCDGNIEGVLHLAPEMARRGKGVEVSVKALLYRCRDGENIWEAEGGGSWKSDDDLFTDTANFYTEKYGPEVAPYVAPVFRLLRAVLDTLPYPKLVDDDAIIEKIELD